MSLEEQIKTDMNAALKAGDKEKLNTLRTTFSQIKDERIKLRQTLTDEEVLSVLLRGVKTRKDSIELYKQGNRQDLVDKETAEINILQAYLPQQLPESEIREKIKGIIKSSGAVDIKDIGKVMGQAMAQLKGKADGKLVQQIARSLLSS
jgi:uncharacterized protein